MASSNAPWHSAFPTPSFDSPRISVDDLVELIKTKKAGVDYVVVDLRRSDFEGAFIKGAVNLPAHSFYPTLSTNIALLSRIPKIVFHCQSCSATGRGPRGAGWYAKGLKERGITTSQALVLDGGIKAFVAAHGEDETLVEKLPPLE